MTETPTNPVAPASSSAVSPIQDYGEMGGGGFDSTTRKDFSLPTLMLLATNSPQCDKTDPAYVQDAEPGMLLTAGGELIDSVVGLVFVPVRKVERFVERVPRERKVGKTTFVAVHDADSDVVREARQRAENDAGQAKAFFKKLFTPEGNTLSDTTYLFGYTLEKAESTMPRARIVVPISSTKFAPYKKLMDALDNVNVATGGRQRGCPMWGVRVRIQTALDKNDKGKYWNYRFLPAAGKTWFDAMIPPKQEDGSWNPLLIFGAEMNKAIKAGELAVDHGTDDGGGEAEESTKAAAGF